MKHGFTEVYFASDVVLLRGPLHVVTSLCKYGHRKGSKLGGSMLHIDFKKNNDHAKM